MRGRSFILFLAIVLTPLGIAAWLGLKVARDEQTMGRHQLQTLLQDRLRDVDTSIAGIIGEVEQHLLDRVLTPGQVEPEPAQNAPAVQSVQALLPAPVPMAETLRALRRKEPLVRELFVIEPGGDLVFPPDDAGADAGERAFRERTRTIWRGDAVLYEPPGEPSDPAGELPGRGAAEDIGTQAVATGAARSLRPGQGDTLIALAEEHDHGWIAWYWEEGLHLLFWRRLPGGGVMGAEVERVALLAQVVARLPAARLEDGRVVLEDSRGQPMHQWGPYEPGAGETPVARVPVSYPLHAWRLSHYASPAQKQALFGGGLRMSLILGVVAVVLAIVAMAAYFYRDYARRLRDAAERVGFVTRVSHELKTPLTNIRLYAELMEKDLDDDDPAKRRAGVIIAESQRLTRLIDNILVFSKKRRDQLRSHKESVQIDEVVEAVLAQFAPALAAKGIAPAFVPGAPAAVHADPDAVGQVIANLVSNVEKYAASGKALHITTAQDADRTTVRVADQGPGIAEAHRENIFRPFYRVSDKLSDGVTGTGIGLAIARDLARAGGGDLLFVPGDAGACFELVLPHNSETTRS